MRDVYLGYAVVGGVSVLLALVSKQIRRFPVTEPLVALLLGVLAGPAVLNLVTPDDRQRDVLLLEGSRLMLALSVTAAALRFRARDLRGIVRPVAVLLSAIMVIVLLAGGATALLLGLPPALALLLGACLSPTDPVLAASVVSGEPAERCLPERTRQLLTVESGANDGLALPLVGVAIAVVLPDTGPGDSVGRLAWEVLGAAIIGVAAGLLAGKALQFATRDDDLDPGPSLVYTLLLAVTVLGISRLAGTDGVLAAFVAGLAYNVAVGDRQRESESMLDEAVNRYLVLPIFFVLGAVLPWGLWLGFGPAAAAFVVGVLALRRLPWMLLLRRVAGLSRRDALFTGWFGPMGVSAVFYLAHSAHAGVHDERLFAAGTLAVAASVVVFGITAAPLTKAYAGNRQPHVSRR